MPRREWPRFDSGLRRGGVPGLLGSEVAAGGLRASWGFCGLRAKGRPRHRHLQSSALFCFDKFGSHAHLQRR